MTQKNIVKFSEVIKSAIIAAQNYKCGLCEREIHDYLHMIVDHNHASREIRGAICTRCNVLLGLIENGSRNISPNRQKLIDSFGKKLEQYQNRFIQIHISIFEYSKFPLTHKISSDTIPNIFNTKIEVR